MTSSETTFNDEELLIWLRVEDTNLTDFAADRIEALLNLNEALVELMDDRDAKLTKVVEAVDKAAALIEERHVVHMTAKGRNPKDYISEWSLIAKEVRATLAELKGETHDPL